jgi:O-antigen/teichoic acid export membrane protein
MPSDFNVKVFQATKWSSITEILAKFFVPISTMILARLLTPNMFGVISIISMVIAFAELFTDAGFQKFIIQNDFKTKEDLYKCTNVAFLTNLILSIILWGIIIVLRNPIANFLGNGTLGSAIAISCVCIPLGAFSSLQTGLFKRDFEFKTLLKIRLISLFVPLLITIPIALFYKSYWALIIGSISLKLVNAIYSTLMSRWKPKLQFSIMLLRQMLSFSSWTILESISIWLSSYIGILIVVRKFDDYYLGLYQTSMTLVVQILSMVSIAVTPVLFSALSRLQNYDSEFKKMLLSFQSIVALIVIPMGFGLFSFRKFITFIILGDQWDEAANFIGLLGLITSFVIVFSHLSSEVYRAKGKPNVSLVLQIVFLLFFVPSIIIAANYGFKALYVTHSISQLIMIVVSSILMNRFFNISLFDMLRGTAVKIIVAGIMFLLSLVLVQISSSILWNIISIAICILFYFGVLFCIKSERDLLFRLKTIIQKAF